MLRSHYENPCLPENVWCCFMSYCKKFKKRAMAMSHESTVVILLMCPYLSPYFTSYLVASEQTASSTATWETSEIFHVSCRETLAIVSRCLLLQPRGYRRRKSKRRATRDARNMNWWHPVFLEDLLCLKSQAVPEVAAQAWSDGNLKEGSGLWLFPL